MTQPMQIDGPYLDFESLTAENAKRVTKYIQQNYSVFARD